MTNEKVNFIAVFATLGVTFLYSAFKRHKQKRMVEDTARSFTSSAPQGLVELQGFAWPDKTSIPLPSQFEGVYYQFKLQKLVSTGSGKNRKQEWKTVFNKTLGDSFYLVDSKGLVLVDATEADFNFEADKPVNWNKLSQEQKDYLSSTVIITPVADFPPKEGFFSLFSSSFRVIEHEIAVGNPLYVRGQFKTQNIETPKVSVTGLTKFLDQVYQKGSHQLKNLSSLMDANRDQNVDETEACRGYALVAQISKKNARLHNLHEEPRLLHGEIKKSFEHGLLIANVHEKHLVERLGSFLTLQFTGGVVFTSLALMALFMETSKIENYLHKKNIHISAGGIEYRKNYQATSAKKSEAKDVTKRALAQESKNLTDKK